MEKRKWMLMGSAHEGAQDCTGCLNRAEVTMRRKKVLLILWTLLGFSFQNNCLSLVSSPWPCEPQ